MAKTYIDVPEVGYKTWLIVVKYTENDKSIEDESDLIPYLENHYPWDETNSHISK